MKIEEVMEQLDSLIENSKSFHSEENDVWQKDMEALGAAKVALKKQIPKKPADAFDYECCVDWLCPTCGRFHRTEWKTKHCSECGQAIDWSDEE